MARHASRAHVRASDGTRLRAIPEREAHLKIASGEAIALTISQDGRPLEIELVERRSVPRTSPHKSSLTHQDMISNAIGRADRERNNATVKVAQWPFVGNGIIRVSAPVIARRSSYSR
jgi:hypothetical protein